MTRSASAIPASTYRLQLHRGFDFAEARLIVPYLARLGVTHVYLSPITTAVPGSSHGYDVVDPTQLSPELGGERAYIAFVDELRAHGMGQVLDIVPNHMGAVAENRWWTDVLRRGPESPYARVYDIDWTSAEDEASRVLLPVLGEPLDQALERAELTLAMVDGEPQLRYFDLLFPLASGSLAGFALDDEDTEAIVARVNASLQTPDGAAAIRHVLDVQHYRLGYWRSAKPRVNYRRFFVIDELVGVRVEDPAVFALTHSLPLRLISDGTVSALRIDHIDGLADPAAYLRQLRAAARAGTDARNESVEPYVVVEKILAEDEALRPDWECAGTTGYDFMRDVNCVLVDTTNAGAMTAVYERFTGRSQSYEDVAYESRRAILLGPLAGQLRAVSTMLYESGGVISAMDPAAIQAALQALLACFARYRTYHAADERDAHASRLVRAAHAEAVARAADDGVERRALDFVADVLASPNPEALAAVERLQQLMPTVQAKGIEDTASYRYARLLSLSEVGSTPGAFGIDVETFHARNRARHEDWPATMLATATHDHKRGEDARARLNVLSELPEEWMACLARWSEMSADIRPALIDRHDEYVLHQVLLGAWPAQFAEGERTEFVERVQDYLVKYAREAAERTTWSAPNRAYEEALRQHAAALLDTGVSSAFLADRAAFQARLSALGAINSLSQLVLKLASPGVADTYQGGELWDLSLVDPDNRRPVDYEARARLLACIDGTPVEQLLSSWADGAVKMRVLKSCLQLRRARDPFFIHADYAALTATGERSEHVVAFARSLAGTPDVLAVAARLPAELCDADGRWAPHWGTTALTLPSVHSSSRYRDVITDRVIEAVDSAGLPMLRLEAVLQALPVALLEAT